MYDADGNTTRSGGLNYVYDFENHLMQPKSALGGNYTDAEVPF